MVAIIATRTLQIIDGENRIDVPIRIFAPQYLGVDWECHIEIEWPDKTSKRYAGGIDAVQALELAMQLIGVELYCSDAHESGRLVWMDAGRGYGFPVTTNLRDKLIGDDAMFL